MRGKAVEVALSDGERAFLEAHVRKLKARRDRCPTAAGSSFSAPRSSETGKSPGGPACTGTRSASGGGGRAPDPVDVQPEATPERDVKAVDGPAVCRQSLPAYAAS